MPFHRVPKWMILPGLTVLIQLHWRSTLRLHMRRLSSVMQTRLFLLEMSKGKRTGGGGEAEDEAAVVAQHLS